MRVGERDMSLRRQLLRVATKAERTGQPSAGKTAVQIAQLDLRRLEAQDPFDLVRRQSLASTRRDRP